MSDWLEDSMYSEFFRKHVLGCVVLRSGGTLTKAG